MTAGPVQVVVVAPVWARPQRARVLAGSLADAHPGESVPPGPGAPIGVGLLFVVNADDGPEVAAVRAAGLEPLVVDWPGGSPGDYGRKINAGARHAAALGADWVLCGADDLRFHDGWAAAALSVAADTGALVVGTNDMHNPSVTSGTTATHPLVHASYLEQGTVDEPGLLMHEGYAHNCVDRELVETAKFRGVWAFAEDSRVEHLHPVWGGAPRDRVYAHGQSGHARDKLLYRQREPLWNPRARRVRTTLVTRHRVRA